MTHKAKCETPGCGWTALGTEEEVKLLRQSHLLLTDKHVVSTVALPVRRKGPSAISPTQRSLKLLRERGYRCAIVEKWNPHAQIRQDLFGFIDILAIKKGETLAVQTTSDHGDSVSSHIRKIADAEAIGDVREAGWRIVVHGWSKKDGRWFCKEVDIS